MSQSSVVEGNPPGYSIRVTSRLTGISSDTLRMWERRYGFPNPRRNGSGVRVYSRTDVERLTLVCRALKAGYRAGEVIHRECDALEELLAESVRIAPPAADSAPSVQSVLDALQSDDPDAVRSELRQAVATLGAKRFVEDVVGPLLERVGDAWAARRLLIRHEHFLTEVISTQLRLLLSAYEGTTQSPVVLLATLPGEQHSLGVDMAALYIAVNGATPRSLGPDTPTDQIVEAARAMNVDVVGVSVSPAADLTATAGHLSFMLEQLPAPTQVWLGGRRATDVSLNHPRLRRVVDWSDLERELASYRSDA